MRNHRSVVTWNGVGQALRYTPRQLEYRTGGPPCAEHLYTRELLQQAFAAHRIVELREHDDVLAEGTQHAGMSALLDCVVCKT